MRVLLLFGALLCATACRLAMSTEPPAPIVYTGALHNAVTSRDQLARLFLTSARVPGSERPTFTATLLLYLGDDSGNEYVGLHYETVIAAPDARAMLLSDSDNGWRLPTIKLTFSENGERVSGPVHSQSEGLAGELSLSLGWDARVTRPLAPLGGIYRPSCVPGDGSRMFPQTVEIVPSRTMPERPGPEGALAAVNYIGNGTCRRQPDEISCINFYTGTYNLFRDTVTLHQGGWPWSCRRENDDTLLCDSPRYPGCTLTRESAIPIPRYAMKERPRPVALRWRLPEPTASPDCKRWDGEFHGTLEHFLGGRRQAARLLLTTFPLPGNRCLVNGTAQLYFQQGTELAERINYPIEQREIDARADEITLQSESYSDLALHLKQGEGAEIAGHWYSRIFGLVGTLRGNRGRALIAEPAESSVQGLNGWFETVFTKNTWRWQLRTFDALDGPRDPFAHLRISGSLYLLRMLMPGSSTPTDILMDGIGAASYDFFTNTLVMRTGWILSGHTDPSGLYLRGAPNRYMAVAMRGLHKVSKYSRVPATP